MSAALCTGSPAVGGACGLAEGETVWPEIHRRGTKGGAHGYHDSLLLLSETDNYQTPFRVPFEGYGDSIIWRVLNPFCVSEGGAGRKTRTTTATPGVIFRLGHVLCIWQVPSSLRQCHLWSRVLLEVCR